MARGGAHFNSDEIMQVLDHYDIGNILKITPLSAGNRRAPKAVVITDSEKYFLKRRPKGKDDFYRVAFAHAVIEHLDKKKFPVTRIVQTLHKHGTILEIDNHIYELFNFISGARYDGSIAETGDAGRKLGLFHEMLGDFTFPFRPLKANFHNSSVVRSHLKAIGSKRAGIQNPNIPEVAEKLMVFYNYSSVTVNQLGFDSWENQVVHGDWHPGNLLYSNNIINAVLDFDTVKIAPAITDLANGMLQFSIVGNTPDPADWPPNFDLSKIKTFFHEYNKIARLDLRKIRSLVDLMIQTMIAESVLPVVATGFFGSCSGIDFLKMIIRKTEWLNNNNDIITKELLSK